jgi:hypothetical protein
MAGFGGIRQELAEPALPHVLLALLGCRHSMMVPMQNCTAVVFGGNITASSSLIRGIVGCCVTLPHKESGRCI